MAHFKGYNADLCMKRAVEKLNNYTKLYQKVQNSEPGEERDKLVRSLGDAIEATGLETETRKILFPTVDEKLEEQKANDDPLSYIEAAGVQFNRNLREELYSMCEEANIPPEGQRRKTDDRKKLECIWDNLSTYKIDLRRCRDLHTPDKLIEVLLSMKGLLGSDHESRYLQEWDFADTHLPVKDLSELRTYYALLCSDKREPSLNIQTECQRVLHSKKSKVSKKFLQRGITPEASRNQLWSQSLLGGSSPKNFSFDCWTKLCRKVQRTANIVDGLIIKDLKDSVSNDEKYFIFAEQLYPIMLCFMRDTKIAAATNFVKYSTKSRYYEGPPSGVLPIEGISMLAAPFCFLYLSPEKLYYTFRAFYIRYCHRLTTINKHPQGIVSLCLLFEKLLQTHEPALYSHFRRSYIQPVRLVFKWLMFAFTGPLPPTELLILWDLIIGFDSVEILPLFAFGILSQFKEQLMKKTRLTEMQDLLTNFESVEVIPVIKLALAKV